MALPPHYPGRDDPFPPHPFAEIFPLMGEKELNRLIESIEEVGQEIPGQLYKGYLLDGRNRYAAIEEINLRRMKEGKALMRFFYEDLSRFDDLMAFRLVANRNLHRRHLKPGQYAMLVDDMRDEYDKLRASAVTSQPSGKKPYEEIAELAGIGGQSLCRAKQIKENAPELAPAVRSGDVSLNSAYQKVRQKKKEALERAPKQVELIEDLPPPPAKEPQDEAEFLRQRVNGFTSNLDKYEERYIYFALTRIFEERNAEFLTWYNEILTIS